IPRDGLHLHAPFTEGKGKTVRLSIDHQDRPVTLESGFDWVAGTNAPKALAVQPGQTIEGADAGGFEKDQGFSAGGWGKLPRRGTTGALAARMDDKSGYRGWDLWIENDRVGMHVVHKFPEDALKVVSKTPLQPNKWYHVCATYDGSGKAAGVRVYLNG